MSGIPWKALDLSESELVALLRDRSLWQDLPSDAPEERVRVGCRTGDRAVVAFFPEPPRKPGKLVFVEMADRLALDRSAAVPLVNELMELDPATWRPRIESDASYRTIAVVECLLAAVAKTQHLTMRCYELTTLACEIVATLDDSWPDILRVQTEADAWREHALALHNLGRYPAAKEAALRSRAVVVDRPTLAMDCAMTDYALAMVLQRLGENTEALARCRSAAAVFRDHGDKQRYVKARLWEGVALYNSGRLQESADLWTSLADEARKLNDRVTLAWLYNNLANTYRQLKKASRANWYFGHALRLFEELGMFHEIPRIRLGMARVDLQKGHFDRALAGFHEARRGFATLHNGAGVAGVELDIVEVLIVTGRLDEAREICSALPAIFLEFGLTQSALEAAAYLREIAAQNALAVRHVDHVREFLRDLPQNPKRSFIRPNPEAGG